MPRTLKALRRINDSGFRQTFAADKSQSDRITRFCHCTTCTASEASRRVPVSCEAPRTASSCSGREMRRRVEALREVPSLSELPSLGPATTRESAWTRRRLLSFKRLERGSQVTRGV